MKRGLLLFLLFSAATSASLNGELNSRVKRAVVASTTPTSADEDDDWDEDESAEIDDDGRVYKNPRNSPSTLCPRDEEQATLLGQKCLRKCFSDEDCKSKKKKCLCDGACGMSCIKPDRECPEPEQIAFGAVTASGKLFGARATYSCQHGYHVVGLQSRTCQADGHWAGAPPACKQNIYCLSPPNIDHARHNALPEQTTFDLDSTLQYYCHTGYVTNGFPRAKCLAIDGQASWYGPDISCEPRPCGPPTDIPHGWHAGECYTYGCRVTYHCAEGYELVGRNERLCQADGAWSPKDLPTCVPVQCPPPENPRHGKAIYTSCSYNSVVSYECKYGYTLVGDETRRCGADRKWTGIQPTCKEINCGHPGRLWNGWLENIEGGTGLGASIIFRCHEGMTLVGNSSTVCQIDGKWRYPLPRCLAPCVVPQVSQGRVLLVPKNTTDTPTSPTPVVQHGEELIVECQPQYEFLNSYNPVICNNGTWTNIPKCEPARCKHLPKAPKNGMVIAPKMEHNMKARFTCKDGFTVKGKEFIECSYGNWTGEIPICQEVYCPFPGFVENGKILLVGNMGLYDYRPYVRKVTNNKQIMYDCNKGYVLDEGPPGATCIGGNWSPKQLPKCILGQHPRLRWSRRRRSIMEKYKRAFIRHHRIINGQHENRYIPEYWKELNNLGTIRSKANGFHSFLRRKRAILFERDLYRLYRRRRALKGKGSTAAVGLGHKSGGSQLNLRRNNKKIYFPEDEEEEEGALQEKKQKHKHRVPCEELSSEPYINIEVIKLGRDPNVSYSSGTVVKIACGKGYFVNLPANKTAKCVRGKWRPAKPECSIAPCHVPHVPNGIFKLSKGQEASIFSKRLSKGVNVSNGEIIEFSCRVGYNVQGPSNLRCWHGEWTGTSLPECTPAPCLLPIINNGQYLSGYRAGLTIANGSKVNFHCDSDYTKSTPHPVECILGRLHPRQPACRSLSEESFNTTDGKPPSHYVGGADIIIGGDLTGLTEYESGTKPCGPPARVQGSLVYQNGEPLLEDEINFPHGTEVSFRCIESIMGEKTTWRIVCEDGSWIGRSLNCDVEELLSYQLTTSNSTCIFRNQEQNVISFYSDQQIREDIVEFPAGTELVSRCIDIGKYAMTGPTKRRCVNGEWDGPSPSCYGLNQENDYSMEKAPTILFRHEQGPIAQSNDGKLIVYPGTILHMECLWIRRFGVPKWKFSHEFRKYPEGWTTDEGRDPQLEYRVSIHHASKGDSGLYTCETPARYSHSVEIVVKPVHCPPVPQRRGLIVNTQSTKMNTRLLFSCANGNALIGTPEVVCLPSGNWSSQFPFCESIECGEIGLLPPAMRVTILSRQVGGQAVFNCPPGFSLIGPRETTCLPTGDWSMPHPTCQEVQCKHPGVLENGYMQGAAPFKAGDVVQFTCHGDFMMEGQPIISCQDNSKWSGTLPKCVQACSYPGTVISGRMSSVKFNYKVGENITFTCDDGLVLIGAPMLKCLRNGKWSSTIPTCGPAA